MEAEQLWPHTKRGSSSVSEEAKQLVQPSPALTPVFSERPLVKPSPQNKWLEPAHFKLQGTENQKMLFRFSQLMPKKFY